jgi:hypothetical protein
MREGVTTVLQQPTAPVKDKWTSAFPMPRRYRPDGLLADAGQSGMSLRDWFAGQALAGIVAGTEADDETEETCARYAYLYADAMMAERSKP